MPLEEEALSHVFQMGQPVHSWLYRLHVFQGLLRPEFLTDINSLKNLA